jgi:hypothetical protein
MACLLEFKARKEKPIGRIGDSREREKARRAGEIYLLHFTRCL